MRRHYNPHLVDRDGLPACGDAPSHFSTVTRYGSTRCPNCNREIRNAAIAHMSRGGIVS